MRSARVVRCLAMASWHCRLVEADPGTGGEQSRLSRLRGRARGDAAPPFVRAVWSPAPPYSLEAPPTSRLWLDDGRARWVVGDARAGGEARAATVRVVPEFCRCGSIRPRLRSDDHPSARDPRAPAGARGYPRVAGEMGGSSDRLPRSETGHWTRGTANHSPHPSLGKI